MVNPVAKMMIGLYLSAANEINPDYYMYNEKVIDPVIDFLDIDDKTTEEIYICNYMIQFLDKLIEKRPNPELMDIYVLMRYKLEYSIA